MKKSLKDTILAKAQKLPAFGFFRRLTPDQREALIELRRARARGTNVGTVRALRDLLLGEGFDMPKLNTFANWMSSEEDEPNG